MARPKPYKPGRIVKLAGLRVLRRLPDKTGKRDRGYRLCYLVECLLCGHRRELSHYGITLRIRERIRPCHRCKHIHRWRKPPLSWGYKAWINPPWEPPRHAT